jgi:hypothetical protein
LLRHHLLLLHAHHWLRSLLVGSNTIICHES